MSAEDEVRLNLLWSTVTEDLPHLLAVLPDPGGDA